MIALTSEKDRNQLREHARGLLAKGNIEGLRIFVEVLKEFDVEVVLSIEALNVAAENGLLSVVRFLVEYKKVSMAHLNVEILYLAIKQGYVDLQKYLIEYGENNIKEYALSRIAYSGNLDTLQQLIEFGIDVHIDNEYCLRIASSRGNLSMVQYLIEKEQANIHALDDYALRYAAFFGHFSVVKYLVEHGANAGTHIMTLLKDMSNMDNTVRSDTLALEYTKIIEYLGGILN